MTGFDEASLGLAKETDYGTYIAPTRHLDFLSETLDVTKETKVSASLRVGSSSVQLGRKRRVMRKTGAGDTVFEALTKGMGLIWEAALGTAVSTQVDLGPVYQQLFTLGALPSLSVQKGLVSENPDGSGTLQPFTMLGAIASSWTFTMPNADDAQLSVSWASQTVVRDKAYVTPSYAANTNIFTMAGACIYTGTLTEPTATALGVMTTPLANVSAASITVSNGLKDPRQRFCGQGLAKRPLSGKRVPTGTLTLDYTNNDLVDAVLSDAPLGLLVEYKAIENADEVLQIIIPEVRLNGELPKSNGGEPVEQSVSFEGFKSESASEPIWVVARTYDTDL